ncbi:MAG: hypothetical protein ABIO67_11905 [Mycobacteriales bacterium]
MQIVVLSARPAMLAGTLRHVRAHLAFIDRVLVVTPVRLRSQLPDDVEVVTDEELLGAAGPTDHSHRNYALRAALATSSAVDDVFLSADDDNRPLVDLPETTFLRDGLYRRYTFAHLDDWGMRATSYDICLQNSRALLGLHGFPRLAYAAHQPQIIDKALLAEVVAVFASAAARHPLDEWATYFNTAGALHPERFAEPEPYLTLGWPEDSSTWQPLLDPGALVFENCFLEHYRPGEVFDGIDPDDTTYDTAVDKVVRWRDYELAVMTGDRLPALATPGSPGGVGKALRRVRTAAVGDPVLRDRRQRAAAAAALRAQARR